MSFLFRAVGMLVLALGLVFAVGDIARSLADEATEMISVTEALNAMGIVIATDESEFLAVVGAWSMAITCGVIGLVLILLGHRTRRRQSVVRRIP
ncbi:hypothetical protein [Jiella marina]|uniref:hypothetical protein n=1 Tax=Jiella sp. LLJ827 TaxID=2917712 RepID=UPI0021011039|nr:hypothetical protein [Jiella sp. LLJ827]MCQ0987726.1 hypothetical protein [Jiella sp. LLJ827]